MLRLEDHELARQGELLAARLLRPTLEIDGARCLDAGCGRGEACYAFADLGAGLIVGYDIGEHLGDARRHNADQAAARFVRGNVLSLPFADASFDVVHSSGVLHHTVDPESGMAEFVRVCRPGGLVYVAVVGHEAGQLPVTLTMRLLAKVVPLRAMSRFLGRFLPDWAVAGLLDVGYATIRRTYSEKGVRRWFEAHGLRDVQRTRSERYDYKSLLSRLWWGVGWVQLSGYKPE